jgi:hypothetical protein
MTDAAAVDVEFTAAVISPATLTIALAGSGHGSVLAPPYQCANDQTAATSNCTQTYVRGTSLTLKASAGPAARFSTYSAGTGGAAGCASASPCSITLTGNSTVTARFAALTSLAVSPAQAMKRVGLTQTFTAVGSFDDGVTETIAAGPGAWLAVAALPTARGALAAAALDGRVYALGGFEWSGPTPGRSVDVYDPASGIWTTVAPLPTAIQSLAATTANGYIYAVGGEYGDVRSTVERYDPRANMWTPAAPLPVPRYRLAAASVDGIIYAIGGRNTTTTLPTVEAYDPATDTWTTRAPLPIGGAEAAGVINGIVYAVGGNNGAGVALQSYDPATNAWTARAPLPDQLGSVSAAVADGVLYVVGNKDDYTAPQTYAYDPVLDAWSVRSGRGGLAARPAVTSLDGAIYAIGGIVVSFGASILASPVDAVDVFADSLRWSSSAPTVASITQQGVGTPLRVGTATIRATAGTVSCGATCATFTVSAPPTEMALDLPANNSVVPLGKAIWVGGWALNSGAATGPGVDAIHVYIAPSGGAAIFLGVATYGLARADVGAVFGTQFSNSGFSLSAGASLAPGTYTIVAFAHDALTGVFDAAARATITVSAPVSAPAIAIDTPTANQTVTSAFEVGGWALDAGAAAGTGVDAVAVYVFPDDGAAPGVYIGQGSYGWTRADVGAIFGTRFTKSGYHFTITGLGPGHYLVAVIAHSTVTTSFSIVDTVHVTVSATALMSIDAPGAESTITAPTFVIGGWSIDRAVESTALSGTGVDTLHLYAFPNPGSGDAPIFLGVATLGVARPDVGAAYGARYGDSGYALIVDRAAVGLAPGVYNIAVVSHSVVSGTFNNVAVIRVTLQ